MLRSFSFARSRAPVRAAVTLAAIALALSAPATAGSIRGSFDRAPFYHGKLKTAVEPAGHAPVTFRGETASLDPDPEKSPALAAILDSLEAELDRLGLGRRIVIDRKGAPDVSFGARRGGANPDGTPRSPDEIDTSERRMVFDVEGPSKAWRERARAAAGDSLRAILTVQLGFGEFWVRQKDWKGNKRIELGGGRALELPWLTSLDDPVQVLQLTGALTTPDGRVLRVGAEALTARRTGMVASMLGAQEILTEEDLAALDQRDASGAPVWRLALRALIENLLRPTRS